MAREKPGFRDNLELLNIRFPDHDMLTFEEVKRMSKAEIRKNLDKIMASQGKW